MSSIGYSTNIPFGPNNPSADQPIMQANTNAIAAFVAVDHGAFNTSTSASTQSGYHNRSTYVQQGGAQTSDATHSPLYAKAVTANSQTINELFLSRYYGSPAASTEVQMTSGAAAVGSTMYPSISGSSFLPGGMQIKFGIGSVNNPNQINYPVPFPNNTLCVFMSLAVNGGGTINLTGTPNASGFNQHGTNFGSIFYWLAIGY